MTGVDLTCEGFEFSFTDAISAFKFDEHDDKSAPNYHGAPMKAVDVIAEFEEAYVFVEIKDYSDQDPDSYNPRLTGTEEEAKERRARLKWLKNYLKYKYRDSFLFRHAEAKVDKPIHYICLMTFENGLNNFLAKQLRPELPIGRANRRWTNNLAQSCHVMNVATWNRNYPKWPLKKVGDE